ncbi:hypothetical protein GF380_00255 [Candidatus Uhrbacteria bacterium]|nr:hypothetical protein [Candidatus Uhrbacteria bacterium]MBD3283852.1 hypothetical protein [Candidatus Uhrbacteria bacterium]
MTLNDCLDACCIRLQRVTDCEYAFEEDLICATDAGEMRLVTIDCSDQDVFSLHVYLGKPAQECSTHVRGGLELMYSERRCFDEERVSDGSWSLSHDGQSLADVRKLMEEIDPELPALYDLGNRNSFPKELDCSDPEDEFFVLLLRKMLLRFAEEQLRAA